MSTPTETVLDLIRAQIEARPDAIAVDSHSGAITYAELGRRAAAGATRLRAMGVTTESHVGVLLGHGVEQVVATLAVMMAGAVYVPIDPDYPLERRRLIATDAGLAVTVHSGQDRPLDGGRHLPVAELIGADQIAVGQVAAVPGALPVWPVRPDNGAYLIFTSGSLGRPKGVLVTHRGLHAFTRAVIDVLEVSPTSRVLQFAALGFDAAMSEFAMALAGGATLVVADAPLAGAELSSLLRRRAISIATLPPSTLAVTAPERCADLLTVVSAGESCSVEVAARWGRGRRFVNGYGPTETTIGASYHHVTDPAAEAGGIALGAPVPGTSIHVLDGLLGVVPVGAVGELFVGGVGVARGYVGRGGLTGGRFVPSPFGVGERLYRTGDLVRVLGGGRLVFVGRVDGQVKVRGFRVEVGEVEVCLRSCPGVGDAVVVVWGDRLVGYVVPVVGGWVDSVGVVEWLRGRLPGFLVPSVVMVVDGFVLSAHGKVDRSCLPEPVVVSSVGFVGARSGVEEWLVGVWCEVLGVSRVGVLDDFFELGGHSLVAASVLARVRVEFGVELGLGVLFERPTVAGLAEAITAAATTAAAFPGPTAVAADDAPLSRSQHRIWFLQELEPDSPRYHVATAVRIVGPLDTDRLVRALTASVHRHTALRTTFEVVDGSPVQRVRPASQATTTIVDCGPEVVRELLDSAVRTPFDLIEGPLWRIVMLRLTSQEHVLAIVMHHLACDGWSAGLLFDELAAQYRGESVREPEFSYADYCRWEPQAYSPSHLARCREYWAGALSDAPPLLDLPTDRPRPPRQTYQGGQLPLRWNADLVAAIHALAIRERATPFMVLLAGLQALLSRYSGSTRPLIAVPVANRPHPALDRIVGCFVNTVAIGAHVDGRAAFADLLRAVRVATVDAFTHAGLPFDGVVAELQPARDLSHSPIAQVALAYQTEGAELRLPGCRVERIEPDTGATPFDLAFSIEERGSELPSAKDRSPVAGLVGAESSRELVGTVRYDRNLFDATTVSRLLDHLTLLLSAATADPECLVAALPLLSELERHHLLAEWRGPDALLPPEANLVDLFWDQVRDRPDAVALDGPEGTVSYGELGQRAAAVADWLVGLGVGPEDRVGLGLRRGVDLIVAVIGVLAAGGAYVPLDPDYPAERLEALAADAGLTVTICAGGWRPETGRCVTVEQLRRAARRSDVDRPARLIRPDQLAHILYTSGSTGQPKGVGITHRNVARTMRGTGFFDESPDGVLLHASSPSFDASTFEIWGCLLNGGRLVVLPAGPPTAAELGHVIARYGARTALLPTGLFHRVLAEQPTALGPLRHLIIGGDAANAESCRAALTGNVLTNAYGPTESTVLVSAHHMRSRTEVGHAVPIGGPISNRQLFVLDGLLGVVPVGAVGELFVGGVGVARGYVGRGGLTGGRFVPSPFGVGERLYRTGDLVRVLGGGRLVFVGRVDGQVKVRGFRVEVGEVEVCLRSCPGVGDAVVVVWGDRLVGYVVPVVGGWVDSVGVVEWLRGRLPGFLVPSVVMVVDGFVLSAHGKVDRSCLPEPVVVSSVGFVGARSGVEEWLVGVWCEVLGVSRVGVLDDFFELGGHSLVAASVLARVRVEFGVELGLGVLFERPTVAGLAEAITAATTDQVASLLDELEADADRTARTDGRPS